MIFDEGDFDSEGRGILTRWAEEVKDELTKRGFEEPIFMSFSKDKTLIGLDINTKPRTTNKIAFEDLGESVRRRDVDSFQQRGRINSERIIFPYRGGVGFGEMPLVSYRASICMNRNPNYCIA